MTRNLTGPEPRGRTGLSVRATHRRSDAGLTADRGARVRAPERPCASAGPWMDIGSETTAFPGMLRAARAFAPRTGHVLDREVLVTGFSQDASTALGLGRALQAGEDR
ncbi:hypothetical protein FKN01_10500 [Streptomyces sp. 130]|uniref:hypothetical protein n=1 Tax=Streptomyces sp. 130 TaxID=2591006 RepID=UPI00117E66D5|nr:hypothetical protein [Streptomyces sp. 130]TRV79078.1 hypothetical protein FKN01_10500 [Streptomyces sp. 130]